MGRAITTAAVLLLGAAVGAWLSLSAAYLVLEPAERVPSSALLAAALAALLVGLAFVARKFSGTQGLVAFVFVVLLGAIATGWLIL